MKKRLVVIGGVAAGPKAASKAKRCDPNMLKPSDWRALMYVENDDDGKSSIIPQAESPISRKGVPFRSTR